MHRSHFQMLQYRTKAKQILLEMRFKFIECIQAAQFPTRTINRWNEKWPWLTNDDGHFSPFILVTFGGRDLYVILGLLISFFAHPVRTKKVKRSMNHAKSDKIIERFHCANCLTLHWIPTKVQKSQMTFNFDKIYRFKIISSFCRSKSWTKSAIAVINDEGRTQLLLFWIKYGLFELNTFCTNSISTTTFWHFPD